MHEKSATEHEARSGVRSTAVRYAIRAAIVFVLFSLVCLNRVGASLDEALLQMGARALAYPGAPAERARVLELNGVSLSVRTQEVRAPLRRVVEHYRQVCANPGRSASPTVVALSALSTASALRDGVGYVACVATEASDLESLVRKLARFARGWDLSSLGGARYVYARRAVEDPTSSTFVLTMWVDGPFDLRRLVPWADRDADGADLRDFPRPPNAQRVVYVREHSAPSTAVSYLARDATPEELMQSYRRRLAETGWSFLERAPKETIRIDGARLLTVKRSGRLVSVIAHRADPGRAIVTLLETRSPR